MNHDMFLEICKKLHPFLFLIPYGLSINQLGNFSFGFPSFFPLLGWDFETSLDRGKNRPSVNWIKHFVAFCFKWYIVTWLLNCYPCYFSHVFWIVLADSETMFMFSPLRISFGKNVQPCLVATHFTLALKEPIVWGCIWHVSVKFTSFLLQKMARLARFHFIWSNL